MGMKVKALGLRVIFVVMILAFWVSLVAAQEEEARNFTPIWTILLAGLFAIAVLGFLMNRRDSSDNDDAE